MKTKAHIEVDKSYLEEWEIWLWNDSVIIDFEKNSPKWNGICC